MKTVLFTLVAAFSFAATAAQDTAGCDVVSKPGYAICEMQNCMVGEASVQSCTVRFKIRPGDSGGEVLPVCDAGASNYPCISTAKPKQRPPTTPEQQKKLDDMWKKQIEDSMKAGG